MYTKQIDIALIWFTLFMEGSHYPSKPLPAENRSAVDLAFDAFISLAQD